MNKFRLTLILLAILFCFRIEAQPTDPKQIEEFKKWIDENNKRPGQDVLFPGGRADPNIGDNPCVRDPCHKFCFPRKPECELEEK